MVRREEVRQDWVWLGDVMYVQGPLYNSTTYNILKEITSVRNSDQRAPVFFRVLLHKCYVVTAAVQNSLRVLPRVAAWFIVLYVFLLRVCWVCVSLFHLALRKTKGRVPSKKFALCIAPCSSQCEEQGVLCPRFVGCLVQPLRRAACFVS